VRRIFFRLEGKFAGIPPGYFGLDFLAIVAVTAISRRGANLKWLRRKRLGIASVGLVFSFYIGEFIIANINPISIQ